MEPGTGSAAARRDYSIEKNPPRVALLLASGVTGAQMPALLGVTAATIKTQLKRCFERPACIRRPSCHDSCPCFRRPDRRSINDRVIAKPQSSRN